ncbi:MAG TPA: hypothetical protein VD757_02605, partial [Candidatus Nitrosocosmicus sp.]|nr:hypothetical protein [Candidatus Nitrosocosmicus sp.]
GVTMLGLTGTGPKYAPTEYIPGTSMTGLITNLHWDLATTPYCIHVDKAGYIYVGSNAKISKYHPGDKSLVWEYILPNNIAAQEMVTDSAGNLYAGLGNFILLKLNPSGGKVWEVTMPYIPKKVTVDSSDWVWVHAYRVYRYDPNGNLATTADVVQANDYVDINWHPSGHIYLAMQYWHYFINPYNNTKVYEAYINYPCVGAKIKDEYQLIVCNTSNASGIRFYKYHQCATKIFELNIHPRGTADGTTYGMGADSQGNVYVASYLNLTGAASQYYLQKVSYDGAHQWGFNPTSPIHKICLDELNGALVCQAIDHALVKRFHHVHQIIK